MVSRVFILEYRKGSFVEQKSWHADEKNSAGRKKTHTAREWIVTG